MHVQVAIKFFLDSNAFRCEEAAVAVPQLRKCMNSLIMLEGAQKVSIPHRLRYISSSCKLCEPCMAILCYLRSKRQRYCVVFIAANYEL